MRKPQPFTIGTRLSIPKCPDFSTSCSGSAGNNHLSGYLVQDAPPSPPGGAAHSHSPVTCMTDRDHLTPGSLVRSIRKITLSRRAETAAMSPQLLARTSHGNCNNNNSRGLRHVTPGAIDPPHDWSVRECHRTAKSPGPPSDSVSDDIRIAPSTGSHLRAGRDSRAPPDIAQLCREIKQVERWVQCKLQDLTDGGDTGSSALLQKKIQTYEGTVLRLSQMVDQVSRAQPSGATSVCSQFQTLRDQWQMLKKMASNQNCTSSGATTLLEFNKKADELEMWMREKEEIPPLPLLLDQNLDKVQITRKILDLRQEQVHYGCLQEDINSLAQKLEKHGRPESRAASTRRKHLNRMWLRLQNLLHEHHQSLQMALEAASLWHEADTILRALEEKSHSAGVLSKDDDHGDQNLRDIASQIMMLDVTVSQVSKLHPLLSSRALQKHQQVKECWARLQHTLRTEKTREAGDPEQSSVGNQEQGLLGGDVPAGCQIEKTKGRTVPVLNMQQVRSQVIGQRPTEAKRCTGSVTSQPGTNHNTQKGTSVTPEVRQLLRELSSSCQWLQGVEQLVSEPTAMRSPELIRKDLKHITLLERQVKARGSALQGLRRNSKRCRKPKCLTEEMEEKIQEVEERFRTLQDTLQRRVSDLRDTLVLSEFMKVVQMEEERKQKETMTPRGAIRGKSDAPATVRSQTFTPLEELQEAVEILNDAVKERERALADSREAAELESKISALSQIMAAAHAKLQDVRSQLEAAEKEFVSVKREAELRDLQGAISQQQQVEADVSKTIGAEVRRLQERREQLQDLSLAWNLSANRSIEDAVRTWNDLQAAVQENKARLQKTERLREFFLQYLGMISWTEVTRDQILSGSPRGRLSRSQREELERTMEKKLKEFEALSGIGWKLIGEDHMLARMIRERLEEVQGLLSWLLMRWRCQKHKRVMGIKANEDAGNVEDLKIASGSASLEEFECLEDEDVRPRPAPRGPTLRKYRRRALSPISFQPPSCRPLEGTDMEEGGPRKCTKGPLWLEPKNLPAGPVIHEPQEEKAEMVTRKLDFQLMEGTLERKHILQLGGRKASSRTWGMFYAVLVRRTLCFYHDHKHSTKRSASAPPLHLTGALCTPESDYTKRDNCFRLRLMDGSEYLFRAPTPESLQLWLIRLRHNSGMEDSDLLREAAVVPHLSPRIRSLMPDLCQSVPVRAAEPVVNPPFWKEAENMAAEIPKPNSHLLLPDTDGADSESNLPGRRRSQSFSSVVYQKVTPVSGPQDSCSSFSVTVYIDEPLIPRSRCHSFAAPQGGLFSRHAADLKPRNKSVFRKFFRKKE
ncbi:spectrin beta chain, non-erythrocytic 5-like isoform X4 [Dendropsophus ebraccatus]|uniref:spectrin beta chain, non-erythrocytic 5-like isoform X4 n=1 Tax=Dendropsophus ebraccatus TaxID=150705 RepID=UPI0038311168